MLHSIYVLYGGAYPGKRSRRSFEFSFAPKLEHHDKVGISKLGFSRGLVFGAATTWLTHHTTGFWRHRHQSMLQFETHVDAQLRARVHLHHSVLCLCVYVYA